MADQNRPDPDPLFVEAMEIMTEMSVSYVNDGTPLDPKGIRAAARSLERLANQLERDHA